MTMKDTEIKIRINCETKVEGEKIMQRISLPDLLHDESPKGYELATRVCDTAEKGMREALIKLGWTPPKDEPPLSDSERELITEE